jgi:methane/ammonia monooxygenase subunit B
MQMTLTITNNGDSAVRLGEFNTASVRFLDADVLEDESGYPDDLLAEEGLTVSDNSPLAPGETRTVEVTASDAAWEVYRLADLIYDPDSRFAGLLFFFDEDGNRQMVMVDAPLIPTFI